MSAQEALDAAFAAFAPLLDLADDFDGEGSPAYKQATVDRARAWLLAAGWPDELPLPAVCPGPDGSIDLFWYPSGPHLLVNIPADPGEAIGWAGARSGAAWDTGEGDDEATGRAVAAWLRVETAR